MLRESDTVIGASKVNLLFALALLGNSAAVAEVAALARDESLSAAEEWCLRMLISQKRLGVLTHPDWRSALLDWLRERGS